MKRALILIIGLIISFSVFATERVYKNYIHSKLNLSLCYNYSDHDQKLIWYYQGLSSALNKYICDQILKNKLDDKKFEIQIGCELFGGHPPIEISQSAKGYFVFIHGLPDLEYLARIVEYFKLPTWESFVLQAEDLDDLLHIHDQALKTFDSRLDRCVPIIDLSFFNNIQLRVFHLEELKIDYVLDELQLTIDTVNFGKDFQIPAPVKLDDKYIVTINDTLKVFNSNGNLINEQAILFEEGDIRSDYAMKAYSEWMNLYHYDTPIISYSSSKNHFYSINTN